MGQSGQNRRGVLKGLAAMFLGGTAARTAAATERSAHPGHSIEINTPLSFENINTMPVEVVIRSGDRAMGIPVMLEMWVEGAESFPVARVNYRDTLAVRKFRTRIRGSLEHQEMWQRTKSETRTLRVKASFEDGVVLEETKFMIIPVLCNPVE